jgi:hypothetical protein
VVEEAEWRVAEVVALLWAVEVVEAEVLRWVPL